MSKKITIPVKPIKPAMDSWVNDTETQAKIEPVVESISMKRLTLDIPDVLHRQIKTSCAQRGTKMAEELRALLEKHYYGAA